MQSLIDGLPPEIQRLLHPDLRKNEAGYWAARDQLLTTFEGVWVAFADGHVIASPRTSLEIVHLAHASGEHPFVACVGREFEATRIRRIHTGSLRRVPERRPKAYARLRSTGSSSLFPRMGQAKSVANRG